MLSRTFGAAARTMRPASQRQIASMTGKDGFVNARRFGGAVVLGSASFYYASEIDAGSDAATSTNEAKHHMGDQSFHLVSADTLAWRGTWYLAADAAVPQITVPHMEKPKTNMVLCEETPENIEPESSSSVHRSMEDDCADKPGFQVVSADTLAMRWQPLSCMYV